MLKHTTFVGALAIALFGMTSAGIAEDKGSDDNLKGVKCLFCKMDVTKDASIDYKGAKLYFGCAGCPGQFDAKNPKHAAKGNAQLVATKQAKQKACPFSGGDINKDFKVTVGKAEVAFCCGNCKKSAEKLEGDAQLAKLFNDKAFEKAFVVAKKD